MVVHVVDREIVAQSYSLAVKLLRASSTVVNEAADSYAIRMSTVARPMALKYISNSINLKR